MVITRLAHRSRLSCFAAPACAIMMCHAATAFAQAPNESRSRSLERSSTGAARAYVPTTVSIREAGGVPANISSPPAFRSLLDTMIKRSATFRRQCMRIAGEPSLAVYIRRAFQPRAAGLRAATRIVRLPGGRVLAYVELGPLDDDVELIAHELEHVIEQLDRIDLSSKADQPGSGVRASAAGDVVFETRRATRIGQRVSEEVREPSRLGD